MKKSTKSTAAGVAEQEQEFSATDYINDKRWVPGIDDVMAGYRAAFPVNVYHISGDDRSGIAGTLLPDGTFTRLAASGGPVPYAIQAWDDSLKRKVPFLVTWDGGVAGGIELAMDGDSPHVRRWDASLTGDWPLNPPKASRLVNPERLREAAKEHIRERKNENKW